MAREKLTKIEVAIERIRSGIDRTHTDTLFNQVRLALGMDTSWSPPDEQDDLPFYPELSLTPVEIGQSRTLMNSIQIMVSKLLSNQIGMKVKKAPKIVQEVMQQYLQTRIKGDGTADGGWIEELRAAGTDGNSLGVGVVQIGLEDDFKSGLQKTTVRRHAPWYVIFDPYVKNLNRSTWVCFVHHLSPEDAAELFTKEIADRYKRSAIRTEAYKNLVELVRVYEYFDLGAGGGDPTRILICGDLKVIPNDPRAKRSKNDFDVLPYAVCTGWESPVLPRPYGRIANELSHDLARRKAEKRIMSTLDQYPVAVINEDGVNKDDMELYKKGYPLKFLRAHGEGNVTQLAMMLPGGQVSDNEWAFLNYTDRQQTKASGITELERGVQTSKRQTRTETLAVLQSGDMNKTFEVFQQTVFIQRFLEKLFTIAKEFDRAPFTIEIQGQKVEFNQPAVPESWLGDFIGDDYEILVDVESLTGADDDLKTSRKIARLQTLAPLVQAGVLSPQMFATRTLEILGEEDIGDWMGQGQQAPIPGQGGQRTFQEEALSQLKGGQELSA